MAKSSKSILNQNLKNIAKDLKTIDKSLKKVKKHKTEKQKLLEQVKKKIDYVNKQISEMEYEYQVKGMETSRQYKEETLEKFAKYRGKNGNRLIYSEINKMNIKDLKNLNTQLNAFKNSEMGTIKQRKLTHKLYKEEYYSAFANKGRKLVKSDYIKFIDTMNKLKESKTYQVLIERGQLSSDQIVEMMEDGFTPNQILKAMEKVSNNEQYILSEIPRGSIKDVVINSINNPKLNAFELVNISKLKTERKFLEEEELIKLVNEYDPSFIRDTNNIILNSAYSRKIDNINRIDAFKEVLNLGRGASKEDIEEILKEFVF